MIDERSDSSGYSLVKHVQWTTNSDFSFKRSRGKHPSGGVFYECPSVFGGHQEGLR